MNFIDTLPVEWMEGMTALADKSGPAFFAIFCMVVGIFLINTKTRRKHVAGYFSFLLAGAIITSITLISSANRIHRYDFKIFDAASTQIDINAGKGLEINASEQEDVWLKSRNNVNEFHLIALRNAPFQTGDAFNLYVVDPVTSEITRHAVSYCSGVASPLYDLRKIEDAPEGADDLTIVATSACDQSTVVGLLPLGAAYAQSAEPSPLAGKLKLSAASTIALRYYDKSSDVGRVSDAVNQLVETEETDVRAFSEPSKSPDQSNALWFGSEVPPEIAGELAIQLIESGVQLQYFGPYVGSSTRINTLEIGHSVRERNAPTLTVRDIEMKLDQIQQ